MNDVAVKPVRLAATARAKVAGAVWWNWTNSIVPAAMLTLVGMALAYIIGWAIDVYFANPRSASSACASLWPS